MRRVVSLAILLSLILAAPFTPARAAGPAVSAPEGIVMDGWTGQVLWARRPNIPRYPASTVKIMTALIVLRSRIPLQTMVTVSPIAVSYRGSTAGLYVGERITVWNLLHGMMLPSGNDAAAQLAETVGHTIPAFVARMNVMAHRLGLRHTHYLSPNGFDQWGQVTTPRDLARLAAIAMHNTVFARIVRTRSWTVRVRGVVIHHWLNLNQLLWASKEVDGVKTGTTPGAGACLVVSLRSGKRWIIVVLMGDSEPARFPDGWALLRYGLSVDPGLPSAR